MTEALVVPIVIASHNLNFGRSADAHADDVDRLRECAEVVCTQEDLRGRHRERVSVRPRSWITDRGATLASLSTKGARIRLRRFAWVDLDPPGFPGFRVVSVHMPPRRYRGLLYGVYAFRLRRLLARTPQPWVVAGDWNWLLRNDPAGLRRAFGARWIGRANQIDGFAVHPDLRKHATGYHEVARPGRNDGHPFCYLTLSPTRD